MALILLLLSVILAVSAAFRDLSGKSIKPILAVGGIAGPLVAVGIWIVRVCERTELTANDADYINVVVSKEDAAN